MAPQTSCPPAGSISSSPSPRSSRENAIQTRSLIQAGGVPAKRGLIAPPMQATRWSDCRQRAARRASQSGAGIASSSMKATTDSLGRPSNARLRATESPAPARSTVAPSSVASRSWAACASSSSPLVTSSASASPRERACAATSSIAARAAAGERLVQTVGWSQAGDIGTQSS